MHAKYIGHKQRVLRGNAYVRMVPRDEHSTTEAFGTEFPRGFWVPIDHLSQEHQEKLAHNPGFTVASSPVKNEPVVAKEDVVFNGIFNGVRDANANLPVYDEEDWNALHARPGLESVHADD